jgi:hypothetical protein
MFTWIVCIAVVWCVVAALIALRVGRGLGSQRQPDDDDES